MSRSIGESLANNPTQHSLSTFDVIHAERDPVVMAEIELSEVAMKVFLANMLVNAIDAALEDRELSLSGIGGRIAAHVLLFRLTEFSFYPILRNVTDRLG